ncbi:MAG: glycosyltransferase [Bacteroidaceae bacterium]|nr:glycosyltransferase [Bacteroidaceae bacterium]MBO4841252.1 glycosyltransferase [Bacteroidaceae bacterium]
MTRYFLVNNASRAAVYGIGTFIRHMTDYIYNNQPQYDFCILDIYSDVKEFTVDEDENGVSHYKVPSYNGYGTNFSYYRCILFLLSSYIKDEENVIFHFNFGQHYDFIRLIKEKYRFSRILFTIHYFNWCFTLNGNLTRFRKLINDNSDEPIKVNIQNEFNKGKRLYSLCDGVIVLSKFTYDLLRKDYGIDESKIHLIYNGMKEDSNIVEYCNEDKDVKEILYVGRLDEIKGIEYIIKAFKQIALHDENVRLLFVGDGNFSQYLTLCEGIWEKVTFTGKVEKEKLEQFYKRATIGVQPSFHEQCSYSAIEMMAHGIPLIATDSTGLGEMMDYTPECMVHIDEENFQPEEFVGQLAEKMKLLLSDRQLRGNSSRKLRQLFHERYNLCCMGNAMRDMLSSCELKDNSISKDFLPYIDDEMIRLINERPVLDLDYVGLTGIGCYLWWRIETLRSQDGKACESTLVMLQEYLIYYIDWMSDVLENAGKDAFSSCFEPVPLNWLLSSLIDAGFYKTKVDSVMRLILSFGIDIKIENREDFDVSEISRTALKIFNLNLQR